MKLLMLLTIVFLMALSLGLQSDPERVVSLPMVGPLAAWLQAAGITELPGVLKGLVSDLWQAARDHHLGPLHLLVLIVVLLLSRKVLSWLLR